MKQRIIYTVLISVLGLNLFFGAQLYLNSAESDNRNDAYSNMIVFTRVLEEVRDHYVDANKVHYPDLIEGALKGMLDRLDPHSAYMDPRRFRNMQTDTRGEFGGIGITVDKRDGWLTIVAPMDGTPGAKAGLMAGDQIRKIGPHSTEKMTMQDAVERLRGPIGKAVTFTIFRPSAKPEERESDVTVVRARIQVPTVSDINRKQDFKLLDDKIGYVRLSQFGDRTADELEAALRRMESKGMRALVMDLRNNPGGLLEQSIRVVEKFLPKGKLVVSTEGRNPADTRRHIANCVFKIREYPLVVLVDGGSASASEIVAGCLKDYKRADLVGEKTFGKGSVQSILQLQNGAALRLTTAKYYTPSHKEIHDMGIGPNHKVVHDPQRKTDLFRKNIPGGLDNLNPKDRERISKAQDDQLNKGLEILRAGLAKGE